MNRHTPWLLTFALFACGQQSHAELQLDSNKKPEQVQKILEPVFESVVDRYNEQHAVLFGGAFQRKITSYTNYPYSNFAWIFNGTTLYSNVSGFVPEIAKLEDCKPSPDELNPGHRCEWRRKGFNVCHLYMFNGKSLKLENVTRLNIARDKKQMVGLPRCNGIEAMAVAKAIPDAMLITIRYSDSAEPADPRNEPPRFYSTVLLRFSDDHGKLKIVQDDSCLGNPNKYKTVATARKALTACSAK